MRCASTGHNKDDWDLVFQHDEFVSDPNTPSPPHSKNIAVPTF